MANAHDLLMAQRAAMIGGKLPYLRRVAYLESHGTEYIDTGVKMNSLTDSIYVKYIANKGVGVEAIAGTGHPNAPYRRIAFWNDWKCADISNGPNETTVYRAYVLRQTVGVVSEGFISALIRYIGKNGVIENQNTVKYESEWESDSIFLFWSNGDVGSQPPSYIRLIETVIKRGDINLYNAIPVLDLSGRPAMYDEVSGQLFYNQGTGEFTWGELDVV